MIKNELYHHGILGQKWGIKHGPPYPLNISKHESRKINQNGYMLKKGTMIYRTTGTENEKNEGETFASFSSYDRKIYNQRLNTNYSNPKAVVFDLTMKLKEDLIVPSQKERVDSFIQYMSSPENSDKIMKLVKNVGTLDETFIKRTLDRKDYNAYVNFCAITNGLNRTTANNFKNGKDLLKQKETIVSEYHDILKRKGYNATVDDLDAINPLFGNNPVIIFDRGQTVEVVCVNKVIR